jgi:AcrR family transcriptional regulator
MSSSALQSRPLKTPGADAHGSTQERILTAALSLFSKKGFEGTSTRAIGSAAGANIAMIAYHFGDKEGLYRAVLAHTYDAVLNLELPSELPAAADERIRTLISSAYLFGRSQQDSVRLIMRHVIEHGSLPAEIRERGTARLFEKTALLVESIGLPGVMDRKLELMSLNHLLVRYILSDLADVALITGTRDTDDAVVRHLGDVAVRLLLPQAA